MKFASTTFFAAALLAAAPAFADDDSKEAKRLLEAKEILPLENIIKKSAELYPGGRVIETELDDGFNRHVYEVEIVDARGVVWDVDFDAKTGEVIKSEQDD
ncbi:MAG: PepSY domain-containing protein [Burkholderiales bacterium]